MEESTRSKISIKSVALAILLLIFMVVVIVTGSSFWQKYSAEQERINQQIAVLNQKQQEIADLENKLETAQNDLRILLDSKTSDTQNQTQIKDAYFLVRLAEDRLQYANDVQAAKQLLQSVHDNLSSINLPELAQVKLLLTTNLDNLKRLNYPDVQETHVNLAILDSLLNVMPLKPMTVPATNRDGSNQKTSKNNNQPGENMRFDKEWKRSLNLVLEDLKSVVKIRKKADANPELSYVNIEINKAQFKLLIEQIRWSIFYRDAAVYQRSVKNAQEMLGQIFDANNENVKKFANTLNTLASVQVQANVPDIKELVNALQALLVR